MSLRYLFYLSFLFTFLTACSQAFELDPVFSDDMVLQRDIPFLIYGRGEEGEKVSVAWKNQKVETVCKGGTWKATFSPAKAGGPYTINISGKNVVLLKNVLFGDVWIAGGQSNMQRTLGHFEHYKEEGNHANFPKIRYLSLKPATSSSPKSEFEIENSFDGKWQVCTPKTAPRVSAVAYFFAKHLRQDIDVPIGIIQCAVGSTCLHCWVPLDLIRKRPGYAKIFDENNHLKIRPLKGDSWQQMANYRRQPTLLYNAMIHPLHSLPIKGVIWYQGYSDGYTLKGTLGYEYLFKEMIQSWRAAWGIGDFPFICVQMPGLKYIRDNELSNWQWLRQSQIRASDLPNTYVATAIDAGSERNAHPPNKQIVGKRLALQALKHVYGKPVLASGPTYVSHTITKDKIEISFKDIGGGLITKELVIEKYSVPADKLAGFIVCGKDRQFQPAEARIEGDKVVVWSPNVAHPVAARYAWESFPLGNLYNKEGLPAYPFRTDDFEPTPKKRTKKKV